MNLDITVLANELIAQLDSEHAARKEGVVLLHNAIMAEAEKIRAAQASVASEPAVIDAEITEGVPGT